MKKSWLFKWTRAHCFVSPQRVSPFPRFSFRFQFSKQVHEPFNKRFRRPLICRLLSVDCQI